MAEFERLRHSNVTRLQQFAVTDTELARTGVHPEFGTVTLSQLLACWATHDLAHINQITRSLVRHWGPSVGPWGKGPQSLTLTRVPGVPQAPRVPGVPARQRSLGV